MLSKRITIVDDRGQQVPLFQWSREDNVSSDNASLMEALARIGESSQDLGWNTPLSRPNLIMFVPGVVAIVCCITMTAVWPKLPGWSPVVLMGLIGLAMVRWVVHRHLIDLSSRMTVTLLAYGRCASCGYSLSGVVAAEGVVGCPECGAGWKSGRIGTIASRPTGSEATSTQGVASPSAPPVRPWSLVGQWNRAPSIVDAGERAVALVELKVLREQLKKCTDRERAAEVLTKVEKIIRGHRARVVAVLFLGTGLFGVMLWSSSLRPGGAGIWPLVVLLCTGLPMWITWIRRAFLGRSQTIAKPIQMAIVGGHFCPACGNDLNDGVPARDGSVACTCGTSWRMPLLHLYKRAEQEMVSGFLGGRLPKL